MTKNDIGTQHFLKRLMDTYNNEDLGIKSRRKKKLITIEEVAKELQTYLNTNEDPLVQYVDLVTGKTSRIDYLENIKKITGIDPETGEIKVISIEYLNKYTITVNQKLTDETNYPVYNLNYNNDFEINWSPRRSLDEEKDTLDPYIYIDIHDDSVFNQIPVLTFSKKLVPLINPYDFESLYDLHDTMLNELSLEEQKFLNVRWFREYDKSTSETRVNPNPTYFSYKGKYKMTFLDGKVNVEDIQFFFNKEMLFDYSIKISS